MLALARAIVSGKLHGRFEGRETQMPADFVIDPAGRVALAHYEVTPAMARVQARCWRPSTRSR
jgi:hypothetical protein